MTRRRWIAGEWSVDSAVLRNEQAAHLARVLRARVGQEFDIVAGETVRRGVIEAIREDAVEFSLHEAVPSSDALPLVIGLGMIRFERMEWAIEKLTELGIAGIVPLAAERSEKHLAQAAVKRVERWRKIAHESAQQSRRGNVPKIFPPVSSAEWLRQPLDGLRLLLSESERVHSLQTALDAAEAAESKTIYAAVGPEGGWTERELAGFSSEGWRPVGLGSRILRAETAAIVVASLVSAWMGS